MQEGRFEGADGSAEVYSQKDAFGDALVGVDGSMFTIDQVLWLVMESGKPMALTKDTKIFCIFDVCR